MPIYGAELQFWDRKKADVRSLYTKLYAGPVGEIDQEIRAMILAAPDCELVEAYVCVFNVYEPEMLRDGRRVSDVQSERYDMGVSTSDGMYSVLSRFA